MRVRIEIITVIHFDELRYHQFMEKNSMKFQEDEYGNWVCEHGFVSGAEDCSECDAMVLRHQEKICDKDCALCQEDYTNYLNARFKNG